jgi:hypothetical protein
VDVVSLVLLLLLFTVEIVSAKAFAICAATKVQS